MRCTLERLEARARQRGRTLQAELKQILEEASEIEIVRQKAFLMSQQIASHASSGKRSDRAAESGDLSKAIAFLNALKQTISPGETSIAILFESCQKYLGFLVMGNR